MAGSANGQPQQASQQPNVFDQSAQAYTQALETAGDAQRAAGRISTRNPYSAVSAPSQVSAQQIGTPNSVGYQQVSSPNQVGFSEVTGAQQINPMLLSQMDLSQYMNPFSRQVTDVTIADTERSRQLAQQQENAQAQAAGAFGGSRHGVAAAETNRAYDDNLARTLAALNAQNFSQAQAAGQFDSGQQLQADQFSMDALMRQQIANQQAGLQADTFNVDARMRGEMANQQAGLQADTFNVDSLMRQQQGNQRANLQADTFNVDSRLRQQQSNQQARIQAAQVQAQAAAARAQAQTAAAAMQGNLSNLGFGMGMQANDAMMRAGGMQQGMQQQLIDQAAQQYGGWSGSPQQSLDTVNNTLGSIPIPQTQTQSSSPGLFDYLTAGAGFLSTPLTGGTAGTTIAGRLFG